MTVGRVVVIGASAAGLLAAAAAASAGMDVTLLERDELRGGAQPRPGVPQGRHPHVLLYRGLTAAEELLPGFRQDLIDAGAAELDTARLAWLSEQGWQPQFRGSYPVYSTTLPVLEMALRARVAALPQVNILDRCTVVGLGKQLTSASKAAWTVALSDGSRTDADLVVDASGRESRLPQWLGGRLGRQARITEVDAEVGYASRLYRGGSQLDGLPAVVIVPTPADPNGGLALPVGNGRWMVLAIGLGVHRPPGTVDGFEKFLAGLRDPALAQLTQRLKPAGDVMVHWQTSNRRRHYEELSDWPDGLLVVGDALCAFNPVYAQGIAIAACEALLLRHALGSAATEQGTLEPGEARRLMLAFAKTIELPWAMSTGMDVRFDSCATKPTRRDRLSAWWAAELSQLAVHGNERATTTLSGVSNLMAPPRRLLHPALVRDSIVRHLHHPGPPAPRPSALAVLAHPRSPAPSRHP